VDRFGDEPQAREGLARILGEPGLYDEFLRFLHRHGHAVPPVCIERDWSEPYRRCAELIPVFLRIYRSPRRHWDTYAMCERLVDLEEQFQLWRFRHLKTVERIIGFKCGTGGTSGVAFLRQALDVRVFPELIDSTHRDRVHRPLSTSPPPLPLWVTVSSPRRGWCATSTLCFHARSRNRASAWPITPSAAPWTAPGRTSAKAWQYPEAAWDAWLTELSDFGAGVAAQLSRQDIVTDAREGRLRLCPTS
jgi:hypothetical protein